MTVPYTFATATSAIPLSQLDSNFATAITLGSTALYLGNTTTTIAGLTLTSPTLTTPALGTPASGVLTNCTGLPAGSITGTLGVPNGGTGVTTSTGTGNVVLSTSPTLVTPVLGTPTSVTLTNGTGLPLSTGVTGTLATTNGGTGLTSFTANGVVYASSTSALATGSALVFDGTNLGIGSTSPGSKLVVQVANSGTNIKAVDITNATNSSLEVLLRTDVSTLNVGGTGNFAFAVGGSEQMRLTSGNVGIGTSSPSARLSVAGSTGTLATFTNGATADFSIICGSSITSLNAGGANILAFQTGGTERARIDSSGNLLVGTTATTGSASNSKIVAGGAFTTVNGSIASLTSGAASTMFTLSGTNPSEGWIVSSDMQGESSTSYQAVYLITYTYANSVVATQLVKGSLALISVSGLNVQYTQSSGGTKTNNRWSAVRIF